MLPSLNEMLITCELLQLPPTEVNSDHMQAPNPQENAPDTPDTS